MVGTEAKRLLKANSYLRCDAKSLEGGTNTTSSMKGKAPRFRAITGHPAAHALARYRCFLPDLAGLAGLRRAGPGRSNSNTFARLRSVISGRIGLCSRPEFRDNKVVSTRSINFAATKAGPGTGSAERFFQWSLYILVVVGFTALMGTNKLDFPSLALVIPALLLRGYLLLMRKSIAISERWTTSLTLIYFVFYAADYFYFSQSFINATVHMVLFSMVIKIFSVRRDRDLMYLAVLSFLMLLAAAVLTVDTLFLSPFHCLSWWPLPRSSAWRCGGPSRKRWPPEWSRRMTSGFTARWRASPPFLGCSRWPARR